MPKRLLSQGQMQEVRLNVAKQVKNGVADKAVAEYVKDILQVNAGNLKSPSSDFQFVWDPVTGERFLFKGALDPL